MDATFAIRFRSRPWGVLCPPTRALPSARLRIRSALVGGFAGVDGGTGGRQTQRVDGRGSPAFPSVVLPGAFGGDVFVGDGGARRIQFR